MTVAELIELLEKQDPAAEVVVDGDPGAAYPCAAISTRKDESHNEVWIEADFDVRHMGRSACR